MSLRFKLPAELVSRLDSFASQAGIQRPFFIAALVSDFLNDDIADPSKYIVMALKPNDEGAQTETIKKKHVRLAFVSREDEAKLREWAERMAMALSTLIEAIIRDRFSDKIHLQKIVSRVQEQGYQSQLRIPEIDTSEQDRIGVVAMLSPELRTAIEAMEKVWSRTTTQQIEQILVEAVDRQADFQGPLSSAAPEGHERKLVRVPRPVHAKLSEWSKRENRSIKNQIVHILHKAVAAYASKK